MGIQIHISTSTACNAKCHFCTYASKENALEPRIFMKWDLYERIIREAVTYHPNIDSVAFSGLQEPLTDKLLEKRIALIRELRPDWFVELYTNGFNLFPERFESLKVAGLKCLSVSLNAVTAAQHEKIMGVKGKFQQTCENIRYARANKGDMRMLVKAVVSNDNFTVTDANIFNTIWGEIDKGDGIGRVVLEMNWAGENRLIEGRVLDPNSTCSRALNQISIHPDGRIGLCCLDPLVKYQFGDLKTQNIKEIYNSGKYVEFREWHRDEVAARHPLCAKCTRI